LAIERELDRLLEMPAYTVASLDLRARLVDIRKPSSLEVIMIEYLEGAAKGIAAAKEAEGLLTKIFKHAIESKDRKKAQELRKFALRFFEEADLLVRIQMAESESQELYDVIERIDKAHDARDTKQAKQLETRARIIWSILFDRVYKILAMIEEMPVELKVANYANVTEIRKAMLERRKILRNITSLDLSKSEDRRSVLELWESYAGLVMSFRSLMGDLAYFLRQNAT
jgi:hypothetical protein